ncbi:hypothetical protein BUALT_Bualt07G0046700 [Buddleja alternifolia]|uniref:Peptidase M10 metallopeptidase domain-containing protein n=1 Tax=Buddleja alternifolia TaxID=168488 RepID=A0AAV6XFX9_9LAMI|nr:hypothetical protein BUALT_Bualt07G0046700 [Buddleja alternifolia]
MVSHYSFYPSRPKWHKRQLKYAFNINVKEEAKSPIERALQEWASITPFKFSRVDELSKANIWISFMRRHHGDDFPFDGPNPRGGVAHSFPPPDGRVHFDAGET